MSALQDESPTLFHITYECTDCDVTWQDVWSCACDDECPQCGAAIEASSYVELEPEPCGVFAAVQGQR